MTEQMKNSSSAGAAVFTYSVIQHMRLLLAALVSSLFLSACAVYTPAGSVVVDPNGSGHSSGGGGFCPPGQAKKGNC